jgi:hypothetical protein
MTQEREQKKDSDATPEEMRNNPGRTPGKAEGEEDAGRQSGRSSSDTETSAGHERK